MANGFSQVQGIEYNDSFASVSKMESIRLVLAIAASKQWEVYHMDVKCSFLHGDLKEEIYMKQIEGFLLIDLLCASWRNHYMG